SSVGHARDGAQISRLRRGLWWVTRAVIAGRAGMKWLFWMSAAWEAPEAAGWRWPGWAAVRRPGTRRDLGPLGGGPRGGGGAGGARRPVICGDMLTARVRAAPRGR